MTYVLITSGLTLIFSIMRIANFAHGAVFAMGGLVLVLFAQSWHINYWISLVLVIIVAIVLGLILEKVFFRPLTGKFLSALIVALGIAYVIQNSGVKLFGTVPRTVTFPIAGIVRIGTVTVPVEKLVMIGISVVVVVLLLYFVKFTKHGRSMRAVAMDREMALLMGVNVDRASQLVMAAGSSLAALSGALVASVYYADPFMGDIPLVKAFLIVALGGMGKISGAIIGGLFLGFLEGFGYTYLGSRVGTVMIFAVIVLTLLVRPTGLAAGEEQ